MPRNLHCPWGGWRETRPEVLGGKFTENNFSLSELAKKRTYSLNDFHFPFGIWALGFPAHPQTSCAGKQLADYRRLGGLIFNQLQVQRGAVYCSDREPPNYRLVQLLHRATKKTFKQTTTTGLYGQSRFSLNAINRLKSKDLGPTTDARDANNIWEDLFVFPND